MLGAVGSREHGMMGCVGAGSKRCFQVSVGTVNPDLFLWLPCYSGPLNWFPERCCLTDSFDPAASPSFLHTTCKQTQREKLERGRGHTETGTHRGRDWKSKARQRGKKKTFFFKSQKTSNAHSLTLSCKDYTHTHTHFSRAISALWSEWEGAPRGPWWYYRGTIVVLPRFLACHIPLQGPDSPALLFSLISRPFIRGLSAPAEKDGEGWGGEGRGEEEWRGEAEAHGGVLFPAAPV